MVALLGDAEDQRWLFLRLVRSDRLAELARSAMNARYVVLQSVKCGNGEEEPVDPPVTVVVVTTSEVDVFCFPNTTKWDKVGH